MVWHGVIGRHGVGRENANGLRLLNLCAEHNLVITNTVFQMPNKYKTTWMHPRSKHWYLIDFIITRQSDLKDIVITRALRGVECWTDHRLLRSVVRLKIRPPIRKQVGRRVINRTYFQDPTKLSELWGAYSESISNLDPPRIPPAPNRDHFNSKWETISSCLHSATVSVFGCSQRRHQDWFDRNNDEIHDFLKRQNRAHDATINKPCKAKRAG